MKYYVFMLGMFAALFSMSAVDAVSARPLVTSRTEDSKSLDLDQIGKSGFWYGLESIMRDRSRRDALLREWKGREVTLEDVPVVKPGSVLTNGSIFVTLGCPHCRRWDSSWHACLRVRFDGGRSDLVNLDHHDRLDSVKLRFSGTAEELCIDCDGVACEVAPLKDPIAGGNAATVAGDELPRQALRSGFGRRQYADLQRRLAGRRLTFHSTCMWRVWKSGSEPVWSCEIYAPHSDQEAIPARSGSVSACMAPSYPLYALVRLGDGRFKEQLAYVRSDPGIHFAEVTATVSAPALWERSVSGHSALVLESPEARLNHAPEQMPGYDPKTVTGDELAALFAKRDEFMPKRILKPMRSSLVGRELSFGELMVLHTPKTSPNGTETIMCMTVNPSQCGLPISVAVQLDRLDHLPHDPVAGDRLLNVSGRVTQRPLWGEKEYTWFGERLGMDQCTIGGLGDTSKSPLDSVAGILSDDALAALDKLPEDDRMTHFLRFCRKRKGRRITLARARMCQYISKAKDGSVDFTLEMGKRDKYVFSVKLPAGEMASRALDTFAGEEIGPVSGILSLAPPRVPLRGDNSLGAELADFTFDFPRIGRAPLPDFDEKTITGAELQKILDEHQGALTKLQVMELVERLVGRLLTLECKLGCVGAGGNRPMRLSAQIGAGVGVFLDMKDIVQLPDLPRGRPCRITAVADDRTLTGREDLGSLSFHDAVIEDLDKR